MSGVRDEGTGCGGNTMKRIRRAVGPVVIFGLCGVVVSYVVGWVGTRVEIETGRAVDGRESGGSIATAGAFVVTHSLREHGMFDVLHAYRGPIHPGAEDWSSGDHMPSWSGVPFFDHEKFQFTDTVAARAVRQGWPFRSAIAVACEVNGKLDVKYGVGGWLPGAGDLVWEPLWPGLLLNAVIYGTTLSVAWYGAGLIRRGTRGRLGRCVGCGYDLQGRAGDAAVCPECGVAVKGRG